MMLCEASMKFESKRIHDVSARANWLKAQALNLTRKRIKLEVEKGYLLNHEYRLSCQ
jgi:hypothetical protein